VDSDGPKKPCVTCGPGSIYGGTAYFDVYWNMPAVDIGLHNVSRKGAARAMKSLAPSKKVKVAHTRLPSVGSGADPGSWHSACR